MATVRPLQSRDEQNFISRLVSDPSSPPSLEVVRGYIGEAAQPQYTRVYLDLRLAEYVDVADSDIKLIHTLPENVSALGESYIWFDRSAQVVHGAVGEEPRAARFLEGRLGAARTVRVEGPGPFTADTTPACCTPKRPAPDIEPGRPTADTTPACCTPKPKPDIVPGKPTADTTPACCTPKPKPDIAPGRPTADTTPACCTPKPRASY